MRQLQRPTPEIERRLKKLEKGEIGSGTASSQSSGEAAESGEYAEDHLYIAYTSALTNLSVAGTITNQSDATDFQYTPFNPTGALLDYRGAWYSKSYYASGDATDYTWVDITSESGSSSMIRYYAEDDELLTDLGNPDEPGSGITWTSIAPATAIPDTAFWLAEQYTVNDVDSSWQVFPVKTGVSSNLGVMSYTKSGSNKPVLNDATWQADVLLAAAAFTGLSYSSHTELGHGATVVITYDDGKLFGILKEVSGTDTWVVPSEFIDGDLVVDGTITTDQIAANTITANNIEANTITASEIAADTITASEIEAGSITSTEIDVSTLNVEDQNLSGQLTVSASSGSIAWGKTGPNDFTNTGLFFGNDGGSPYFLAGSAARYFLYDGGNDILFFTGETTTGPAVVGANITYNEAGTQVRHDLPASVRSIRVEMVGAGSGGAGLTQYDHINDTSGWQVAAGSNGVQSRARLYDSGDNLISDFTAAGSTADAVNNSSIGSNTSATDGTEPGGNAPAAAAQGEAVSSGNLTGTGGIGWDRTSTHDASTWTGSYTANEGTIGTNGAGGGAGGYYTWLSSQRSTDIWVQPGNAGTYVDAGGGSISTSTSGYYLLIDIGAGGAGGGIHNVEPLPSTSVAPTTTKQQTTDKGGPGGDGAVRIEILTLA